MLNSHAAWRDDSAKIITEQ